MPRSPVPVIAWAVCALSPLPAVAAPAAAAVAAASATATAPATESPKAAAAAPGRPTQTIRIDVRGAAAHVTVTRAVNCVPSRAAGAMAAAAWIGRAPRDAVLDIALPERSALLDVQVDAGGSGRAGQAGHFVATKPLALAKARDAYLESLRAVGTVASELPFEDEARFRFRIMCRPENAGGIATVRYSFSTLLELSGDGARLIFPAAAELSPPPTRVEVQVQAAGGVSEISIGGASHPVRAGAAPTASETVSMRTRWNVSIVPLRDRPEASKRGDSSTPTALLSVAPGATGTGGSPILAYTVGAPPAPRQPLPERILFLLDRSRSVGPGGLEAERNLARRILEAMPPATRFDALFFDRGQKRLFPVARTATREAISALEDEMVSARLTNGTDLPAALRAAGDLIRREASDFSPRTLLIVLSDGAVGKRAAGPPPALTDLVGALPGVDLLAATISVRANDDEVVSPDERRALRTVAVAASLGGIERGIRIGDIPDAVPAILDALRAGGDVHAVEIGTDGAAAGPSPGRGSPVAEVIAAGGGASGVVALPTASMRAMTLAFRRGPRRVATVRPTKVDRRWLAPLLANAPREARLLLGPATAALVEPVVRPASPAPAAPDGVRGYMERSVVRDALSLAFTPRARACYLNRSARTPADRDLTGRVRLALDLLRGEVGGARVEASTLGHPIIENCLREAAYALEVPRAYRNDDPVTAVLNLVFKPRNPERRTGAPENPSISNEIDMLVEAALKEDASSPAPTPSLAPNAVPAPAAAVPATPATTTSPRAKDAGTTDSR